MEPATSPIRPTLPSRPRHLPVVSRAHDPSRRNAQSRPLLRLRSRQRRGELAPRLRSRSPHRLDSFQSPSRIRIMNALASRMPALGCAPSLPPRFNPFAVAARTTVYDQIAHSIGGDAADKLIADFGGRRLYIPLAPGPGDLITRSIGLISALAMARVFGSDRLLIPVTSTHLAAARESSRCALTTSASRASR